MFGILAVGNDLRGDDGVGLLAGRMLEKKGFQVVFGHESPENVLGALRGFEKILVLDATHFEGGGAYRIVEEVPASYYTHKMSLDRVRKVTGARVWLVGIKTYNRRMGEAISEEARANVRRAVKVIEMCMSVPGKIVNEKEKMVEILGETKKVKFGVPGLKKGDLVLIHAGAVIEKLSQSEFDQMMQELKELEIR
ncbi:MAG TPA: hydrogenase maturation protease [archaeon]|nr:hydrogenase maturation protease [archaeon]